MTIDAGIYHDTRKGIAVEVSNTRIRPPRSRHAHDRDGFFCNSPTVLLKFILSAENEVKQVAFQAKKLLLVLHYVPCPDVHHLRNNNPTFCSDIMRPLSACKACRWVTFKVPVGKQGALC